MSIDGVYEQWKQEVTEEARLEEARQTLIMLYQARFGALPGAIAAAIAAMADTATLKRWIILAGTRSSDEVAAAVQAGVTPASAS